MQPSPACEALVKQFEGSRLKAYPDPKTGAAPWTIGVGHTGPEVHAGLIWTQAQVDAALRADLARFGTGVWNMLANTPTTQGQFDALTSFAFNCGLQKLATSTLLKKHRARDYAGAAAEFGRWINKGSPVEAGLRRRRAAESALYSA